MRPRIPLLVLLVGATARTARPREEGEESRFGKRFDASDDGWTLAALDVEDLRP